MFVCLQGLVRVKTWAPSSEWDPRMIPSLIKKSVTSELVSSICTIIMRPILANKLYNLINSSFFVCFFLLPVSAYPLDVAANNVTSYIHTLMKSNFALDICIVVLVHI